MYVLCKYISIYVYKVYHSNSFVHILYILLYTNMKVVVIIVLQYAVNLSRDKSAGTSFYSNFLCLILSCIFKGKQV